MAANIVTVGRIRGKRVNKIGGGGGGGGDF